MTTIRYNNTHDMHHTDSFRRFHQISVYLGKWLMNWNPVILHQMQLPHILSLLDRIL